MLVGSYGLGFSLNPIKAIKRVAHGVTQTVKYTAKGTIAVAQNPLVQRAAALVPGGSDATSAVNTAAAFLPGKSGRDNTPASPGEVDLRPTQDASDGGGGAGKKHKGATISLPGIGAVPRTTALIGAAAGGVLLLVLLTKKR